MTGINGCIFWFKAVTADSKNFNIVHSNGSEQKMNYWSIYAPPAVNGLNK